MKEDMLLTEGERIRKLRKSENLTLAKFGERIGMRNNSLSELENNKHAVTEKTRIAISQKFHVSYAWLETGEGEMKVTASKDEQLETFFRDVRVDDGFKKRFVRALAQLNERDWEAVEKMAHSIYEQEQEHQPKTKFFDDMTRDEKHAELDRMLDLEEEAEEESDVSTSIA